jgi:hypothetical protein
MSAMIAAQCRWIYTKTGALPCSVFTSLRLSVFLDACLLYSVIGNLRHALPLSSVTLFLPYAKVRHQLTDCRLDVTLSSYTSKTCRRTSAVENVLDHKCTNTVTSRISKPETFSTRVNVLNRKLHNEELNDLYSSPNILRVIKSRRMRWAGHVARMEEGRGVHKVFVGKTEGKIPLGRPRRR